MRPILHCLIAICVHRCLFVVDFSVFSCRFDLGTRIRLRQAGSLSYSVHPKNVRYGSPFASRWINNASSRAW